MTPFLWGYVHTRHSTRSPGSDTRATRVHRNDLTNKPTYRHIHMPIGKDKRVLTALSNPRLDEWYRVVLHIITAFRGDVQNSVSKQHFDDDKDYISMKIHLDKSKPGTIPTITEHGVTVIVCIRYYPRTNRFTETHKFRHDGDLVGRAHTFQYTGTNGLRSTHSKTPHTNFNNDEAGLYLDIIHTRAQIIREKTKKTGGQQPFDDNTGIAMRLDIAVSSHTRSYDNTRWFRELYENQNTQATHLVGSMTVGTTTTSKKEKRNHRSSITIFWTPWSASL